MNKFTHHIVNRLSKEDKKSVKNPMVSVCVQSYQHRSYIKNCIEGILMQKVDFPLEILIRDDASTDGTTEIVQEYSKKYPHLIKPLIYQENQYIKGVSPFKDNVRRAHGKYIAVCEGDDYWTDPYKLQKQVDFLEAHPDYGMVHGDVNLLNVETGEETKALNKTKGMEIPSGDIFEFLMKPSHSIRTATVCFRRDLFFEHYFQSKEIRSYDWFMVDISIWLMLSLHTKIKYFDEVWATYRLLPESMSRSKNPEKLFQFHQKIRAIRDYYLEKQSVPEPIIRQIKSSKYHGLLADAFNMDNKKLFLDTLRIMKTKNLKLTSKEIIMRILFSFPYLKRRLT